MKGSINVDIILDKKPDQKYFKVRTSNGDKIKLPIYTANDDISGEVKVELKDTNKYEHLGIKVMLVGYLGNLPLIQKFSVIETYQHNFIPSRKNCSQQASWHRAKISSSNSQTSKNNTRLSMVSQVEFVTSFEQW